MIITIDKGYDDSHVKKKTDFDPPMFATAFRGSNLTEEEESALDHLFDMMTAVKQQVLLRKALHNENI